MPVVAGADVEVPFERSPDEGGRAPGRVDPLDDGSFVCADKTPALMQSPNTTSPCHFMKIPFI